MKYNGLTSDEVKELMKQGKTNYVKRQSNQTYLSIFVKNIFTYFNFIFALISILLILAGAYRNLTFLPVVIANILIGIFQQIRSKIVLDKLSLLDKTEYYVLRDGKEVKVTMEELVLGDLVKVSSGKQIPADGIIIDGNVLVNESLLTGEADEIEKSVDDELKSGSFIISGEAYIKLIRVGVDSYSAKLMLQAKEIKEQQSEMVLSINRIVKFFGIIIIPIGALLFSQSYFIKHLSYSESIVAAIGAVIGMIPEGMYLLTTITLALSAMRLAKKQVLLHDMRSVETLARVDVLCVDKTGTITESKMTIDDIVFAKRIDECEFNDIEKVFSKYVNTITDTNITMKVLKEKYVSDDIFEYTLMKNFDSKTKYSMMETSEGIYKFGAPDVLLDVDVYKNNEEVINSYMNDGKRVLVFCKEVDGENVPLLFTVLVNKIRQRPYSIVLFDEIEKAHASVFDVFLQIMDEGKLHDRLGKEGDFSNAIILFTSNIGSDFIVNSFANGKIPASADLLEIMTRFFRPEFLGRLTEIIPFAPISKENALKIFEIHLKKELLDLVKNLNITLNISEEAKEYLSEEGYDIKYGARPLKGVIRGKLRRPLAKKIVAGEFHEGDIVSVTLKNGELHWEKQKI